MLTCRWCCCNLPLMSSTPAPSLDRQSAPDSRTLKGAYLQGMDTTFASEHIQQKGHESSGAMQALKFAQRTSKAVIGFSYIASNRAPHV